jgi:poly(3-hydroxybutyrate) depolymerase
MSAADADRTSRRTLLAGLAALFLEGCSRLGFLAANAPAVFGSYKRHANIAYGPDPKHRLDVYMPQGAAAASRPVVVFWHGGRWREGDKSDYRFVGAALAECGYVAVIANYRHYPQVKMPGFMDDAAQAASWADAHAGEFGGARERLYLMGHSAGAQLAALVTLDPRYFAATGRAAHCRPDRTIGAVRLPAVARSRCSGHVWSAAALSAIATHQLCAHRCAAHASDSWPERRDRASEELD